MDKAAGNLGAEMGCGAAAEYIAATCFAKARGMKLLNSQWEMAGNHPFDYSQTGVRGGHLLCAPRWVALRGLRFALPAQLAQKKCAQLRFSART